ncbi:MAG: hypothetical protein ABIT82_06055 [Ramlibacter sp.]
MAQLRQAGLATPALGVAVGQVKQLQSRRFAGTYVDLLSGSEYAAAARFFLEELYSDRDYADRDVQFARIAGTIEKLFPAQVVETAVALAKLHAATEALDQQLGLAWLAPDVGPRSPAERYVAAWRSVGRRPEREAQLNVVLEIGVQMARLTRTPGLRMMLRMMRAPAAAAGMAALQRFLEIGFDTFGGMARRPGGAERFLAIIRERESALITALFEDELVACGTSLEHTLGQAR